MQYLSHGSGYALFLTFTGAVISLEKSDAAAGSANPSYVTPDMPDASTPPTIATGVALPMNLIGANPGASSSTR